MEICKRWIWPGLVAMCLLAALALWFRADAIEKDLKSRVLAGLKADHPWASVLLDGRDLTLSGTAPDAAAQAEAMEIARSTYDVRLARDNSVLIPVAKPYLLSAEKAADGIHLTGFAPNDALRARIGAEVSGILPGIAVRDDTKLARGAPEGLADLAGFGTRLLSYFATGQFDISDTGIAIRGTALSPDDQIAVEAMARSELPPGSQLTSLSIMPATLSGTYTWTARFDGSTIQLDGFSPDTDGGAAVARLIANKFANVTIDNRLKPALGALRGFESVSSLLLQVLSRLDQGAVSVSDGLVNVEGEALTEAARTEIARKMAEELPAGYTGSAAVSLKPVAVEPLAAGPCQARIDELLAGSPIRFAPGETGINPDSFGLLDRISHSVRRCDGLVIEIRMDTAESAPDAGLSAQRAQAVLDYMVAAGVDPARLRLGDAVQPSAGEQSVDGTMRLTVRED